MEENRSNFFYLFIELSVLFMILLVIIQTFLEDFSVYKGWSLDLVDKIKLSAVFFDLFFTFEFLTRFIDRITKGKGFFYFFCENGWIDFISSIPLLLLISLPEFLLQIKGFNLYSVFIEYTKVFWSFLAVDMTLFKFIKAVRIIRILRFARVLKIFGKIKSFVSDTVQRQIAVISTIVVTSIILFFLILNVFQEYGLLPKQNNKILDNELTLNRMIVNNYNYNNEINFSAILNNMLKNNDSIIKILINGIPVYEANESKKKYMKYNSMNDSDYVIKYDYDLPVSQIISIYYSRFQTKKLEAFNNLIMFSLIIVVLFSIIIIYTKIFKSSIADPVFVMRMGFEKINYVYNVKIRKHLEDDDIFILANDYNNRWLPAKMRKINEIRDNNIKLKLSDVIKDFKEIK
ncbi:MAG: hypothetical protein JXB50_02455 [Spirochaetes bacterium]|nr:hypothetical protein [Spirochaetota bacterium]